MSINAFCSFPPKKKWKNGYLSFDCYDKIFFNNYAKLVLVASSVGSIITRFKCKRRIVLKYLKMLLNIHFLPGVDRFLTIDFDYINAYTDRHGFIA